MTSGNTSSPANIPIPVPSVPLPFYRRWGIVEWSCATGILTFLGGISLGVYTLIGDRAIAARDNQGSVETLKHMDTTLERVEWYEKQNWEILYFGKAHIEPPPMDSSKIHATTRADGEARAVDP
jgi:hypothetical protein